MPEITVHTLKVAEEATWDFRGGVPRWGHPKYPYALTGVFDPFPGYAHDIAVARTTAERVQQLCPPLWDVEMYLADREEEGRSNGYSNVREQHRGEDDPPLGFVMLSGKRIPPHPALTRYLVAHEYGHNVSWMLGKVRGARHMHDLADTYMREYAEMRGLPPESMHHGNGGTWHDSVYEVFACDFRILVCKVEIDFWPHPGVPYPRQTVDLMAWWERAKLKMEEWRTGGRSSAE